MAAKKQIRLYLDEDVPHPLAKALRRRGVDAVSTLEAGNLQLADEKQLEYAISQGRAIMTFNIDSLPTSIAGGRRLSEFIMASWSAIKFLNDNWESCCSGRFDF